jgi:hypothetical protein
MFAPTVGPVNGAFHDVALTDQRKARYPVFCAATRGHEEFAIRGSSIAYQEWTKGQHLGLREVRSTADYKDFNDVHRERWSRAIMVWLFSNARENQICDTASRVC